MGKLSDYIAKKRETEENIQTHNIITNEASFARFLENIEDLDFASSLNNNFPTHTKEKGIYTLRVLLDESPIKYPNSENYPFIITMDTQKKEIYMAPHSKSYIGIKELENLDEWLNDNLPVPLYREPIVDG